jgi:urease accessory protein
VRSDAAPAWTQVLLQWTSPAFPVGAFSYSHGLEWLVERGTVSDRVTLRRLIDALIGFGDLQADAVALCAAHRAEDGAALFDVVAASRRFFAAAELMRESLDQGAAFLAALKADNAAYPRLDDGVDLTPIPHAVAFGAAARDRGIPLGAAVEGWLHAAAANIVSAGQRLIPLGQRDGVGLIHDLAPDISAAAAKAMATPLAERSATTLVVDMAAIHHETQYTRLFRS